jgi:hypothetical protein
MDDFGPLTPEKSNQPKRLPGGLRAEEAAHRKGMNRDARIPIPRHQRPVRVYAHDRQREARPIEPFSRPDRVQLGTTHLHVVDAIHDPDRVARRSDCQACLMDAMVLQIDD